MPNSPKALQKLKRLRNVDELSFRSTQLLNSLSDRFFLRLPHMNFVSEKLPKGFGESERDKLTEKNTRCLPLREDSAQRIIRGCIEIFGSVYNFGDRLPWLKDFAHEVNTPTAYWNKVPFLNAELVGDSKVVWELNRLQYTLPAAKAYFFTKNSHYYEWLKKTILDWIIANPFPMGINWSSSLELAFRAVTFDWVIRYCREPLQQDDELRCAILGSLYLHGRHISRYLSTYFSPNTHLSGEALGLYLLGLRYPFLPNAEKWRDVGKKTLLNCLEFQILPDGGYFERSLWYHRYTIEIYLMFLFLAEEARDPLPPIARRKLNDLLSFMIQTVRSDGTFPLIGDDDGGRLIALDGLDPGDIRGLMAACAVFLDRGDLKYVSGGHTEMVWSMFGSRGIDKYEALVTQKPKLTGSLYPDTGYAFLRNGWEHDAAVLSMDAGPLGAQNCGHAHSDALSITFSVGSTHLLTDPGTFSYTLDLAERNAFRDIDSHCSPGIDEIPLSVPSSSPFHWDRVQQDCRFDYSNIGSEMDMLTGICDDCPDDQTRITITRKIIFLKPKNLLLVWDTFVGAEGDRASSRFVLNGSHWKPTPKGVVLAAPPLTVELQTVGDKPLKLALSPCDVSPAYLQKTEGYRFHASLDGDLPATMVTAVRWGREPLTMDVTRTSSSDICVRCGGEKIWCFVGSDETPFNGKPFETDASAACVVERDAQIEAAWALNVSKLTFSSTPMLNDNQKYKFWGLK